MSSTPTPTTEVAEVTSDHIVVRGFDLANDLIGHTSISEYFWVLLTGSRPTTQQAAILDACVVAIAEHGLVPSVQAARMTYAAGPESLHGAVAAGLLGCGSVILGSSDETADVLEAIVSRWQAGDELAAAANAVVVGLRESGRTVPGLGHPIHRLFDPRTKPLLAIARELGFEGQHVRALDAMVAAAEKVLGRSIPLNVSGVIPAVLLDADFPRSAMKGVPLIGRTMSLMAHLLEEAKQPLGFHLAAVAEKAVIYVGATPTN